jgi:hypothetical protein
MKPYWIETGNQCRLAIVLRPRGGRWLDVDTVLMKEAGVDRVDWFPNSSEGRTMTVSMG